MEVSPSNSNQNKKSATTKKETITEQQRTTKITVNTETNSKNNLKMTIKTMYRLLKQNTLWQ